MRLFLAVQIPSTIKEQINKLYLKNLNSAQLKIVPANNLHITLCFIGQKNNKTAREILGKIGKIEFTPFKIKLSQPGQFERRVLWIGISQGTEQLHSLHQQILQATGIESKFSAHITIARNKNMEKKQFLELEQRMKNSTELEFVAQKISLMQSKLTSNDPIYEELEESTFSRTDSGL
ncbi:MAG TPA: RNA 2',3'-cyclic phosphodiesterase [archaeon]|nr:RNA 2',3'-cyclic phosphodiesterase [archaeon]